MPTPARGKAPVIETLSLEERVRRRAYELYVQRGNESGSEVDNWLFVTWVVSSRRVSNPHAPQSIWFCNRFDWTRSCS
jgi:hypothetical protein